MPPAVATMLPGVFSALEVQYIRIVLWVAPFIGARGPAKSVEWCTPALVAFLYRAMFGITQILSLGSALFVLRKTKRSSHHEVFNKCADSAASRQMLFSTETSNNTAATAITGENIPSSQGLSTVKKRDSYST